MHEEPFRGSIDLVRTPPAPSQRVRVEEGKRAFPSLLHLDEAEIASSGDLAAAPPQPALERHADFAQRLVTDPDVGRLCREQYRRVAAGLHQLHGEGLSVVMVASAMRGEGKTLTAANLALTFSQSYRREVLLVDADLRRPLLHRVFGVSNEDGLNDFLAGPTERKLPVHQIAPWLSLLPAGEATDDPMARLTCPRMKRVFAHAPEAFDWIFVDTPPMGVLPDAGLLASMVDGVLLVVNARSTPYAPVKRAIDTVGRARIVGIVLNRAGSVALASQANQYDRYYSLRTDK